MRPLEIDWLFSPNGGAASLAPKGYAAFRKLHAFYQKRAATIGDVLHARYERFKDPKTRDAAARAWASWEGAASSISRRSGVATFSQGDVGLLNIHQSIRGTWRIERRRTRSRRQANRTRSEDYFNGTTVPERRFDRR